MLLKRSVGYRPNIKHQTMWIAILLLVIVMIAVFKFNFGRRYWVLSLGQAPFGRESVLTQLAKPFQCVHKSHWRGGGVSSVMSPGIETRLTDAMRKKERWGSEVQTAIDKCGNGVPMMQSQEYGLLFSLLQEGDLMLEWGSGISSCVWANAVGELHSIESDADWAGLQASKFKRMENQVVHFMPALFNAGFRRPSALDAFDAYVKFPERIGPACHQGDDTKFDVILVDGRARPQCAFEALLLLREGGLMIIHDWDERSPERDYYNIVLRWYELVHLESTLALFRMRSGKTGEQLYAEPGVLPRWWTETPP